MEVIGDGRMAVSASQYSRATNSIWVTRVVVSVNGLY